jgi:DNA-binding GntR family transcriptional regulator
MNGEAAALGCDRRPVYISGLDPEDPRPPSKQIADQLRSAIFSGQLQADTKLPSQNQLATRYGVARETVKAALRQLASEDLIVSRLCALR